WNQLFSPIAGSQIFNNRSGLGDGQLAVADHRGFAERMHRAQLGRREHGLRVALVALHLVGQAEFFEQPEDALRARIVEVMDGDHGFSYLGFPSRTSGAQVTISGKMVMSAMHSTIMKKNGIDA